MIPSDPVANYVNTVQSGNLLFISGKGPLKNDGEYIKGKLGYDLTIDQGYEAARATGINLISTIKSAIGDLRNVKQIIISQNIMFASILSQLSINIFQKLCKDFLCKSTL